MLRALGALFIMAGAGGFGYLIAGGLEERAAILRRLVAALQHLESDMVYASLPLQPALQRAAQTIGGAVGGFLHSVAEAIGRNDGEPLARAWSSSLTRQATELLLSPNETEVLAQLGRVLGGSDREDQQKHLTLARVTLAQFQAEAEAKARKTKRVWQYLGLSLGALAVIFLY